MQGVVGVTAKVQREEQRVRIDRLTLQERHISVIRDVNVIGAADVHVHLSLRHRTNNHQLWCDPDLLQLFNCHGASIGKEPTAVRQHDGRYCWEVVVAVTAIELGC